MYRSLSLTSIVFVANFATETHVIQLHVVGNANRYLYENELDQYFRARHQVYVKERGWKELDRPDGREIDQFDTTTTIYLIALENGRVFGGHRLIPTVGPTMMGDVFPQLAMRGLVCRADAYELSRIFVVSERRGEQREPRVESIILAGTMEFALTQGISQFTIVMETWWIPRLRELGWNVRPLGAPVNINGMITIGVAIDVTERAWTETCNRRSVNSSVLAWRGAQTPVLQIPILRRAAG
jgi:acyl-homoserine lactone synthase